MAQNYSNMTIEEFSAAMKGKKPIDASQKPGYVYSPKPIDTRGFDALGRPIPKIPGSTPTTPTTPKAPEDALPTQPTFEDYSGPSYTYKPITPPTSWSPPKIVLPDYSKMPQIPDYTGRIEDYSQRAIQSGLQQLQELTFNPEYEVERERLESRGLVGGGVENEVIKNLMTSQQARAGEFATNIQNEAFRAQTQELQNLRAIEADRQNMVLEQQFEAAVKQGDWGLAKKLADDKTYLDLANVNEANKRFEQEFGMKVEEFNKDVEYKNFSSEIEKSRVELEREKFNWDKLSEERKMEIMEEELELGKAEYYLKVGAASGLTGGDLINHINAEMKNYGYTNYDAGTEAGNFTAEYRSQTGKNPTNGVQWHREEDGGFYAYTYKDGKWINRRRYA